MREIRKEHDKLNSNLIMAARATAEMEATAEPTGEDISQLIKDKARQLGYLEVGITNYDPRYDYKSKRGFTVLPKAICLAYEQDFEPTQTIPSVDAEIVHSSTYRTQAAAGLELGNFIPLPGLQGPRRPLQRRHRPRDPHVRGGWPRLPGRLRLPAVPAHRQPYAADDDHH